MEGLTLTPPLRPLPTPHPSQNPRRGLTAGLAVTSCCGYHRDPHPQAANLSAPPRLTILHTPPCQLQATLCNFLGRFVILAAAFLAVALGPHKATAEKPPEGLGFAEPAAANEFFESKIRPVLVEQCYSCHSADSKQVRGGLLVDHQAGLLRGGDSGPAIVAGNPDESLLIGALKHESFEMPPKGRLPDTVIDDFIHWIEIGAPDPRTELPSHNQSQTNSLNIKDAKKFWSFQPIRPQPVPSVIRTQWPNNEIDYFILHQLEAKNLKPVSPATKHQWIRRATFDLTGLPPTPEEIAAFLADYSTTARETVIQRLLDSPHYGERWGRHWLDVARYAEDQAHTFAVKPSDSAHRYRDWVIKAFNDDLPYNAFVKLQIAADLMPLSLEQRYQHLPALGFFGLGAQYYKNSDAAKARADELDDRVDTLTRGFLGLTVSCARCHDHKYDPIPTQDYYSLAGVFQSCRLNDYPLVSEEQIKNYDLAQQRIKSAEQSLKDFVAENKQQASEAQASRLAEYVMATIRFRRSISTQKPDSIDQLATELALSKQLLNRWIEAAKPEHQKKNQVLKPLFDLLAKSEQLDDENFALASRKLAGDLQSTLVEAIEIRAGKIKPTVNRSGGPNQPGTPIFSTPEITKQFPIVDIEVKLDNAKELYLVITDAGNGKSCDHADWISPRFQTTEGEVLLTDLKWKDLETGFGSVNINKSVSGQPLRIANTQFDNGLGSHAPSIITYEVPATATKFIARVGLDNGGSDQGVCGEQASVQFRVYTERPNDYDLILQGELKPDQIPLTKQQSDLLNLAFSDDGLLTISDEHLEQILADPARQQLTSLRDELRLAQQEKLAPYPVAHTITDAKPTDLNVYIRGNPARQGELAPRRFLRILSDDTPQAFTQGSGRLELAQAIAHEDNPLTARVIVNRVWQHHFGRGLVATPSNFGSIGQRPSHPELLDFLALRLIENGWSLKSLHRDIMLSSTYNLSSNNDPNNNQSDADNEWLWRMNRRRLDVEAWRDALLAVSGRLDPTMGGPSMNLDAADNLRRTVYGKVSRHELNSLLRLFDFPDANITSERRSETTVPQQQLFVLNSPFMINQSKALAKRFFEDQTDPPESNIKRAFMLLYGRPATTKEIKIGSNFLQLPDQSNAELTRAQQYAQVLLAANEFTFID